jgi:mono/diheme cytochrome c family protein
MEGIMGGRVPKASPRRGLRGFVIAFVAIMALGLVVLNIARRSGTNGTRADVANSEQVALGQQVYATHCASCHGAKLEGQPNWKEELPTGGRPAPPHDASGHTWHHPDSLLFDIISRGGQAFAQPPKQYNMPAFGSILSDTEIWAVIAYLKSTWPPDIQAAQELVNQQGR